MYVCVCVCVFVNESEREGGHFTPHKVPFLGESPFQLSTHEKGLFYPLSLSHSVNINLRSALDLSRL
jgi:hypothetical protein